MLNIASLGIVLMTNTILFAITLAAVFSVAMVAPVSAVSSAFLDIKKVDEGENSFKITTKTAIPKKGAGPFGYGLVDLDSGKVIAATSHAGVLDSDGQDDADDGSFHTHLVQLTTPNAVCTADGADFQVDSVSQAEVGDSSVKGNKLTVSNITEELPGADGYVSFTLSIPTGNPADGVCVHPVEVFS